MANTYKLITSTVLGTNATSVTFSDIPQTFSDLEVRMYMKTSYTSSAGQNVRLIVNAGAISFNWMRVANSMNGWSNDVQSNIAFAQCPGLATSSADMTNAWGMGNVYIGNYADSSYTKSLISKGTFAFDTYSATQPVWGQFIASTTSATAISSIKLEDVSGGSLLTGSQFHLYGIN